MKKQRVNTKLELNKSTIANLGQENMNNAKGGAVTAIPRICLSLPTCPIPSFCKACTDEVSMCLSC